MKLTTGMRCSTPFHSCTSRAPRKLVASRPVTKTMTRVKMAPSPGTWTPIQLSVCSATGSSSSDWSSVSKMNFSTQIVMIKGIQMSSPVIKYFFTAPETKRPGAVKKYFITGLLIWIPLIITIWVLKFIFDTLDRSLLLLPVALQTESWIGVHVPGLGAIFTLVIVFVTGLLATNFLGARLVQLWNGVLH